MFYIEIYDLMKKFFLTSLALVCLSSCNSRSSESNADFVSEQGMIWNTSYHITYQGDPALKDSVIAVLNNVSATFNVFNDSSLVARVNRQDSTPVNDDFIKVYATSVRINRLTDGAFDPTLAPLIKAWGFEKGHKPTADTLRIDSLLQFCGIAKTHISGDALVKQHPLTRFNFSAIAKGYGCDCVGKMFIRNGVDNWLVEIGGEVACNGKSPSGELWKISIDRPLINNSGISHDSQAVVAISGKGMATSGNYRNFHADKGTRFGHTISSVTGRPVQSDVASASVIADDAMTADALATAFMAMGADRSIALATRMKLPVLLVLSDSTVRTTPWFDKIAL